MKLIKNGVGDICPFDDSEGEHQQMSEKNQQLSRKNSPSKPIKKPLTISNNQIAPRPKPEGKRKRRDIQLQQKRSDANAIKGRPQRNQQEKKHLNVSRQFNNILQHYSKILIYFYMMKKQDNAGPHSLSLQIQQNDWINQAINIMNTDNFPSNIDSRKQCFLLHPNSLHFIFQQNKINKITKYSSEQIKYYLFAFLSKKGLLTSSIYIYICQYWTDIIDLFFQWIISQHRQRKSMGRRQLYVECEQNTKQSSNSRQGLQNQMKMDKSIAAYQVACYLKSCYDYFSIQISSPKKQ